MAGPVKEVVKLEVVPGKYGAIVVTQPVMQVGVVCISLDNGARQTEPVLLCRGQVEEMINVLSQIHEAL